MGFAYLNDKNWTDITRDERFFCTELYVVIKKDTKGFVKWLSKKIPNLPVDDKNYEVGFEVCFFRDYIKEIGETDGNKSIKNSQYSQKRTFDLCIFSDNCIIVIEAKAYTGFNTKQLDSFDEDRNYIKSLLADKCPEIFSVGLVASEYKPKQESVEGFDCIVNWKEMYDLYKQPIFLRANKTELVKQTSINALKKLIFSNLPETKLDHSVLCNQRKRLREIWNNEGDAKSNAIASERFLKLILIAVQFVFPGIYIRAIFGKCGMLWKNLGIEFYVYLKIIIAFIVLYFQFFRFTIYGHRVLLYLTIYLTVETILYVATLIFCSDVFAKPRSYKRSIILVFFNYFEIVLNFATFYLAAGALKDSCGSVVVKSLDAAYFSFITAVTIGYGDITPVSSVFIAKILIIMQSIIFLIFGVIFLNFFASKLPDSNKIKEEEC